jgi:hypothetical protein
MPIVSVITGDIPGKKKDENEIGELVPTPQPPEIPYGYPQVD